MDSLATYLPATILDFLAEEATKLRNDSSVHQEPPYTHSYKTCVLFADVSGFTALCEAMTMKYPKGGGDEFLAKHLNSYFELLLRTLSSQGGDVFKFAGDALLVVWPPSAGDDLTILTRRAAQCALEVKQKLTDAKIGLSTDTVSLNIKVGVGVGKINILHVGGVFGRMEYLATGDPLVQAFHAEHQADKKDAVVSPEAWDLCKDYFIATMVKEKGREDDPNAPQYAFLESCIEPLRKCSVRNFKTGVNASLLSSDIMKRVMHYIPGAVVPWVSTSEEKWASELRRVTVLFVNVGLTEEMLAKISGASDAGFVQRILKAVQLAVYKFEGSLNKFLMDDKGSTLIAVFGLPPLAHEDDSMRAVMSAHCIVSELRKFGLCPAVGVSSGMAFCGVVGSRGRREYSVLGDSVNLAARLMQFAGVQKVPVLVDAVTHEAAQHNMQFQFYQKITVKGKTKPVATYQPIAQADNRLFATIGLNPAVYANPMANTRLTSLPALVKGGRFLPLPASFSANPPDSYTPQYDDVVTAQARLFPTSPLLSPAQAVYNVRISKLNNYVVSVGNTCADSNHVLHQPIALEYAPIKPCDTAAVIPADLCPPRLVPAILECKTQTQADMGHNAHFVASPVQYLQAVDYLRSQNKDGGAVESIIPAMDAIFVHKDASLQDEDNTHAPQRLADARFNALNDFCEFDKNNHSFTVVPVKKALECEITTVGDLLRFTASQLKISLTKRRSKTTTNEKGVARVEYRQSVTSPHGNERKHSVAARSKPCPIHKEDSSATDEVCGVEDFASGTTTTNSTTTTTATTGAGAGAGAGVKPSRRARAALEKQSVTDTIAAVHRDAAQQAQKVLENTDLVLSLSLTSFGDAALRSLAQENTILDYRFTHAHSSQPIVLPNSMPLTFLMPLLHAQNARTALFLKQTPGSPNALVCATNSVLSLNIGRMANVDMDSSYLCRLRDQLVAFALRCAGHTYLSHHPSAAVDEQTKAFELMQRNISLRPVLTASTSIPAPSSSPSALKTFFATPVAPVEMPNKGKVVLIESEVGLGKSRLLDLVIDTAVMPTIVASATPLDVRKLSIVASMAWQLLEEEVAAYEACHAAATLYMEECDDGSEEEVAPMPSLLYKKSVHDAPRMSAISVSSNISELITKASTKKRNADELRRSEMISTVPEEDEEVSIEDLSDEDFEDVISITDLSVADADNTVTDINPDILSGRQAALKSGATLRRLVLYTKIMNLFHDTTASPQYTRAQVQLAQKDLTILPELPTLSSANIRTYIPIFADIFPELSFKDNDTIRSLHAFSRVQILSEMIYTWLRWASVNSSVPVPAPALPVFDRSTQSLLVSSVGDDDFISLEPNAGGSPAPSISHSSLPMSPTKTRIQTYNASFSNSSGNRSHFPTAPAMQSLPGGLMIIVDCAVHMDAQSWSFLAGLPAAVPHSMLVISTRPVNKLHMGAFVPDVPSGYLELACDSATVKMKLRSRSNSACNQLVMNAIIENEITNNVIPIFTRKAVATVRVPLTLAAAIGSKGALENQYVTMSIPKYAVTIPNPQKSPLPNAFGMYLSHVGQGNPRVLQEVVITLVSADMISFGSDFVPLCLQDTLENYPDIDVDVPVPAPLQSILGSRIDRLNQNQCMLLKVAATIGNVFTFNSVAIAFPLVITSCQLAKELDRLVELHLVKRVHPGSDLYERLIKSTANGPFFPEPAEKEVLQDLTNTNNNQGIVHEILYGTQDIEATERDYSETVNNYKAEEHRNKAPHFHLDRYADECIYVFRQGFMRDMLLSRMLQEQKNWLVDQIVKEFKVEREKRAVLPLPITVNLSLQGDKIKAETCLHATTIAMDQVEEGQKKLPFNEVVMNANPYGSVISHSSFHIKKHRQNAQEFKPRYVALHKEWITIWRTEEDFEQYMQFADQQAQNTHILCNGVQIVAPQTPTTGNTAELELVCTCNPDNRVSTDTAEDDGTVKQRAVNGFYAPFATIDLRHAKGDLIEVDGDYNIVIECGRYMKKGNYHSEKRVFHFNCNSRSMAEQWKIMLDQSCVETGAIARERDNKRDMRTHLGRMLRADIDKRVTYTKDEKAQLAEDFFTTLTQRLKAGMDVLEADVLVHKRKSNFIFKDNWKQRHIVLTANGVHFRDIGTSSGLYTPPSQACALNVGNVRVQHLDNALPGHPNVLEVIVDMWVKGASANWKPRSYILSFKTENECEIWYRAITKVIRSHVIARIEEKYKSMLTLSTQTRTPGDDMQRASTPIKRQSFIHTSPALPTAPLTNTTSESRFSHNRFAPNSTQIPANGSTSTTDKPRISSSVSTTPTDITADARVEPRRESVPGTSEPAELVDYYNAPKTFMVPTMRLGDHWFTGKPRVVLGEEYDVSELSTGEEQREEVEREYSYHAVMSTDGGVHVDGKMEDASVKVVRVRECDVEGGVSETMVKTLYHDAVLLQRTKETAHFLKQMASVIKDASAARSTDPKVLTSIMTLLSDAGETLTRSTNEHRRAMHSITTQTTAPWVLQQQLPLLAADTLENAADLSQYTLYNPTTPDMVVAADGTHNGVTVVDSVLHMAYENESDEDTIIPDDIPSATTTGAATPTTTDTASLLMNEEVKMILPANTPADVDLSSIATTGMKEEDATIDISAVRAQVVTIIADSQRLWLEAEADIASQLARAKAQRISDRPHENGNFSLDNNTSTTTLAENEDYTIDPRYTLVYNMKIVGKCGNWNYNILQCSTEELILVVTRLFCAMGIPYTFNIPADVFANFVVAVYLRYRDNFYHNFRHAVDVTQSVFVIMTQWQAYHMFNSCERFALMLAAISHDLNHPGTNNTYQVNANTELYSVFGKAGVLERYHCFSLFHLLADPATNILVNVNAAETKTIRHMVFQAILSTDMTVHFELIEKISLLINEFKTTHKQIAQGMTLNTTSPTLPYAPFTLTGVKTCPSGPSPFRGEDVDLLTPIPPASPAPTRPGPTQLPSIPLSPSARGLLTPLDEHMARVLPHLGLYSEDIEYTPNTPIYFIARKIPDMHKTVILNLVLHAADISNPAKAWEISSKWATNVVEEFFYQGDLERASGLPISLNCAREEGKIPGINLQFIDGVVAPLYKMLFSLLPASRHACPNMINNFKQWYFLHVNNLRHSMEAARAKDDRVGYAAIRHLRKHLETREKEFVEEMSRIGVDTSTN